MPNDNNNGNGGSQGGGAMAIGYMLILGIQSAVKATDDMLRNLVWSVFHLNIVVPWGVGLCLDIIALIFGIMFLIKLVVFLMAFTQAVWQNTFN